MQKKLLQKQEGLAIIFFTGVWRSLVARTAGGREVAGSNPVAPIVKQSISGSAAFLFIFMRRFSKTKFPPDISINRNLSSFHRTDSGFLNIPVFYGVVFRTGRFFPFPHKQSLLPVRFPQG